MRGSKWVVTFVGGVSVLVWLAACTPESHTPDGDGDADTDSDTDSDADTGCGTCAACGLSDDDSDGISNADEGSGAVDTDRDGIADNRDTDSDDDGLNDTLESGREDCGSPPEDCDGDGIPNFQDVDSDGNGLRDEIEGDNDMDGDGVADYCDLDDDGDQIDDELEIGPDPTDPADSDGDGIYDYHDRDSDNDGIPDERERAGDVDRDGLQNFRDPDADGDGILDSEEGEEDCDGDGLPNFLDRDSDNDGVTDAVEREIRSDPCLQDTDGDGLTDLVEQAIGTDPNDATSGIGEDEFFVILPYNDPAIVEELEFTTNVKQADVYFLTDTTGSMGSEIANIRRSLSTFIVPEVADVVRDVEFGYGRFDDVPISPYGSGSDVAYSNVHDISGDIASVQAAIDTAPTGSGADGPESHVVAMYCTATGEGMPAASVEPSPGCLEGRFGYPCFRPYSLPVILLFTDYNFHNGPPDGTSEAYSVPDIVTWLDAIAVMNDIGAKVLGFSSEGSWPSGARVDLDQTAVATGAVVRPSAFDDSEARLDGRCAAGMCCTGMNGVGREPNEDGDCPLVWSLTDMGDGLDLAVVDAIADLSTQVARDVSTVVEESPLIDDGVDAADFITSVVPLRADPEVGVDSFDETHFYGVQAGTLLTFEVTFQNTTVPETLEPQVFVARIVVVGDDTVRLDDRRVIILIPPSDIPIG
jgi:hypothetical protein